PPATTIGNAGETGETPASPRYPSSQTRRQFWPARVGPIPRRAILSADRTAAHSPPRHIRSSVARKPALALSMPSGAHKSGRGSNYLPAPDRRVRRNVVLPTESVFGLRPVLPPLRGGVRWQENF